MRKKRILTLALLGILIISNVVRAVAAPMAPAAPSRLLTYQGHLLDTNGLPVADAAYPMTFSLWDADSVGQQLWGPEAHTVTVRDGYFALLLGTEIPLDAAHFTGNTYLEIAVGGETLTPRQPLGAVAYALGASQAEHAVTADDAALLGGAAPEVYLDWRNFTHIPDGFADGIDNDTIYTDADALSAVQAAGYLTATGVIEVLSTTHTLTVTVAHALTASDAETLNGQAGDYYLDWRNFTHIPDGFADGVDDDTTYSAGFGLALDGTTFSITGAPWSGLTGIPEGFADGIDNDTIYTDTDALAAVSAAGYVTSSEVISVVNQAGYVTDVQVQTLITNTTSHTATYAYTAGDAVTFDGQDSAYYLDWYNFTNVPDDFADGVDNDTTYTAGSGLALDETTFSVTGAPWSGLTGIPEGFADGIDNDTIYTDDDALSAVSAAGYVTSSEVISIVNQAGYVTDVQVLTLITNTTTHTSTYAYTAGDAETLNGQAGDYYLDWRNFTHVPDDFADGVDNDTTYTAGSGLRLDGTTFSVTGAPWSGLTGVPAGFADGVDNDTTYTAGTGLTLSGTQFSVAAPYRLPQSCTTGQIAEWNGSVWTCAADNDSGGDITAVNAGTGLTGGGTTGSVTLAADTAYLQRRVSSTCAAGSSIRAINADGTVTCEADDNTTYTGGTGLALSGTQFSVAAPYRLPQTCASGQMPQWNGTTWGCGSPVAPGYARTLIVAASGGDFTTVQAAVNSITNASATNPYLIWIAPGVYAETVTLKPYVHLQGAGRDVTVLQGSITDDDGNPIDKATLILDSHTSARDLTVNNSGSSGHTRVSVLVPMGKSDVLLNNLTVATSGTANSSYTVWIAGRATLENVTATASGGTVINAAMMVKAQSATPPFPAEATLYGGAYTASGTNAMGIKVENLDSRLVVNAARVSASEAIYSGGWVEIYHSRLEAPTRVVVNTQAGQPERALVKYTEFVGAGGIFNALTCVAVSRGAAFGATTCP